MCEDGHGPGWCEAGIGSEQICVEPEGIYYARQLFNPGFAWKKQAFSK